MTIIHVPNDSPALTHATIDASLPGDLLIFDAGRYVFNKTVILLPDRRWRIIGQRLLGRNPFLGDYLIFIPPEARETPGCYEIFENISGCE